jgi:outer membrane biosynthesis protein TonB
MLETWRARAAATAEVRRIHSGLAIVDAERRSALLELGAAAHRGDGLGEAGVRARLADLDEHESRLRGDLDARLEHAGERIRKARLSVQDTMMVTPNQPNEPYPPPGEATPPQPAIVPEPYPPPDEGTPPAPAPVPEPGPEPDK